MSYQLKIQIVQMLNDMAWALHDKGQSGGSMSRTDNVKFDTIIDIRNRIYDHPCWGDKPDSDLYTEGKDIDGNKTLDKKEYFKQKFNIDL